jgi:hypothetical protein
LKAIFPDKKSGLTSLRPVQLCRFCSRIQGHMARKKRCRVFVSYSRHDESLVKPLAGLLGAAADDAVFLDVTSIKPGEIWKTEIEKAVREASVFILCWCCESEKSSFIAYEIQAALSAGEKRLVPVLFCSTPLPATLADRQWIDLRERVVHLCNHEVKAPAAGKGAAKDATGEFFTDRQFSAEGVPPRRRSQATGAGTPLGPPFEAPSPVGAPLPAPPKSRALGWGKAAGIVAAVLVAALLVIGYVTPPRQAAAPPVVRSERPAAPVRASSVEHYGAFVGGFLGITALIAAAFVTVRMARVLRRRKMQRQTEEISAAAKAYFEGLGRASQR